MTAVIYLQSLTGNRLGGSALANLDVFRDICGSAAYANIILATTFWTQVVEPKRSQIEKQISETNGFWGSLLAGGAEMIRLSENRGDVIATLHRLAHNKPVRLQLQTEIASNIPLARTRAGSRLEGVSALANLEQEFEQKLALAKEEAKAAADQQRIEMSRERQEWTRATEAQMQSLMRENERLKAALEASAGMQIKTADELQEVKHEYQQATESLKSKFALFEKEAEARRASEQVERKRASVRERRSTKSWIREQEHHLFLLAESKGLLKARTSSQFLNFTSRYCDQCLYKVSAQLSYGALLDSLFSLLSSSVSQAGHIDYASRFTSNDIVACTLCEDFDVCSRCWDKGLRCFETNHNRFARRSLIGTVVGTCKRACNPLSEAYPIECDSCGKRIEGVRYYRES